MTRALWRAARVILRFGWRVLLLATLLLFVGAAVVGPNREGTAWLVVLVGLVAVGVAEGLAWFLGPVSWRPRLRRWGVFAATFDKLAYAWFERVATAGGNRLVRDAGLLGVKEEDLGDVRLYRPKGREPWAVVPPLPGLTEERLSTVMQAQAWRYAGVGATVAVEAVPILDQWVVRFSRVRVLPGLVRYRSGLTPTVDAIPVGVDESGEEVSLRLRESNALVAGLPGSGKSGFLNALIASAVGCSSSVALYGIDPKRVELAAWRPAFVRIATEDGDFLPLLDGLAEEMNARYAFLEEHNLRKFARFDASRPLIVLVVDELAEVVATGDAKHDKPVASALRLLVQKGRAAGICVIAATQRPSSDIIPTSLRDLFVQRVAFATSTVEMTRMVLGDGMRGDAPGPESIGGNEKGVGFMLADTDRTPRRFKAYWLSDKAVAAVVDSLPADGKALL